MTCNMRLVRRLNRFAGMVIAVFGYQLLVADTPAVAHRVVLLYVGAEDCGPCRIWQRGPEADFRNSDQFGKIDFREVKSPKLFNILDEVNWPEDLRPYRSVLGPESGAPLWLVIVDGRIVKKAFGIAQWNSTVLPTLRILLR